MTYSHHITSVLMLVLLVAVVACNNDAEESTSETMALTAAHGPADEMIALAESAAPPEIAREATILDMEGNVLREGINRWTCVAMPDQPMCLDEPWMVWLDAYVNQKDHVDITEVGISYMLQGDPGVSNIDPYAEEPTADNDWVKTGPHLMLVVPDPALLEGIPDDPEAGGPYVMWRGTPLEHVMIPIYEDAIEMLYRRSR